MTEKVLNEIVAREKRALFNVSVIHRSWALQPMMRIVLVGVSSAHRDALSPMNLL